VLQLESHWIASVYITERGVQTSAELAAERGGD